MFTLRLAETDSQPIQKRPDEVQAHLRTSFGYLSATFHETGSISGFHQDSSTWIFLSGFTANLHGVLESLAVTHPATPPAGFQESSALIARIYRSAGIDGLRRLEGCFALCVLDFDDGSIHLLRDRLGGRSVFVYQDAKQVLVASHAHRIAAHPDVRIEENPDYLGLRIAYAGFPPPGITPFRNIEELLPGHHWQICDGQIYRHRQGLEMPSRFSQPDAAQAVEGLGDRLYAAIIAQTDGCNHFASMLSGGLDSAPATALMARHLAQRDGRVRAVSWSLSGANSADETGRIQETAAMLGIELRLFNGLECVPFSRLDGDDVNPGYMEFNAFRPLHDKALGCAQDEGCEAIVNFTAGDFLYPTAPNVLGGLIRGREWTNALGLATRIMFTWNRGRRPWRNPILRGYLRRLQRSDHPARPFPYRLGFMTDAARRELAPLPAPFTEAEAHPVPSYARFLQTTMAYHRAHESYFAERRGMAYLDPYQSEPLARYMLALPFGYSYRDQQNKWIMRQVGKGLIPESIRTTPRTGNLLGFLKFGYRKHRQGIVNVIEGGRAHWRRVLREDRVDELLGKARPSEADLVLICQLLGYCLWCRRWQ